MQFGILTHLSTCCTRWAASVLASQTLGKVKTRGSFLLYALVWEEFMHQKTQNQ